MDHKNNECTSNCKHIPSISNPTVQTLDSLEFERGIWQAAVDNDIQRIQYFIDKKCVNLKDKMGYSALHYSARNGNFKICKMLINAGANVNEQTNGGATPLHRAAMMDHKDIVELLLDNAADPYICDLDGRTVLHRAELGGKLKTVNVLLARIPDLIDVIDKNGKTASQLAPK